MTNKRPSAGYLYDAALLLVCLALLSSCIASGLFAKFVSGNNDDDEARVAKWNVAASANATMELLPSGNGQITYPITITRNNEVSSTCTVTVVFDEDMSDIIENPHIGAVTPNEGASFTDTLTFSNVVSYPATNGATEVDTIYLVMQVKNSSSPVDDYDNDFINGTVANVPFSLTINVRQID